MPRIVLVGNAITARILYGYLRQDLRYEVAACVVDDAFCASTAVPEAQTVPISRLEGQFPPDSCKLLMALGYAQVNTVRQAMYERLIAKGYSFETYVHPKAMIYTEKPLGDACVILPGALVEPGAEIGQDTFLFGNAVVAHDAKVGAHCWLAAGVVIAGMATVGQGSFVGVNATVSNKVEVGPGCIVGGAAFISKNIKANTVYLARSAEAFRCTAKEYATFFGM